MKWRSAMLVLVVPVLWLSLAGCGKQELDADPEQWRLDDFESCFEARFNTDKEEYLLLEGTKEENTVRILRGKKDGPTLYIVAGVHGDETAGWLAGNLLKQATLKAGTLYILSPANTYGAGQDRRKTESGRDLNRNFPGNSDGWDAERIAASIYGDIRDKQPELVLDLHEAVAKEDDYEALGANYDALGNSLICQSLDGIGELVLDALLSSEAGELCSGALALYGLPPTGSLNRVVTEELGIPVITVETLRAEPLTQRVQNQLELAEFVLKHYGMR
ncbi:MAG: succinylglutamate desuccinylase/aspartoacylase family protein [Oscillospiraceae bacterium]|nr:succinylglutamate desuccinylase/aspartoacylase family protein [Oscillospiraceae bacterium]